MFGFREDILAGGGDGELLDPGLEEEKVFTDNLEYSCLYRYTGGGVFTDNLKCSCLNTGKSEGGAGA